MTALLLIINNITPQVTHHNLIFAKITTFDNARYRPQVVNAASNN